MKFKNLTMFFILVFLIVFTAKEDFAQNVSKVGTTTANFLEIGVGGSGNSMGGAFVSLATDASALYWNVSGIAVIPEYQVIAVHTNWIADTKFDFAGLVVPVGDFGTIGFSFTSLSTGDMAVRTIDQPEGTGEFFTSNNIAIGISYARNLTDRFSLGITGKYVRESIWHMSASAFAIDAGTLFRTDLLGGMIIGAKISNFGTTMQLNGRDARQFISVDPTQLGTNDQIPTQIEMGSYDLPLLFQMGVSASVVNSGDFKLILAVDALVPSNNYQSLNLGTEFSFQNIFFVRGGYHSLFLKDSEGGLSFGFGLNTKMLFSLATLNFDYAFRDFGRLENVHTFSVNIKF